MDFGFIAVAFRAAIDGVKELARRVGVIAAGKKASSVLAADDAAANVTKKPEPKSSESDSNGSGNGNGRIR